MNAGGTEAVMVRTAGIDVGTSAIKVSVVESARGSGRTRAGARVLTSHVERIRRRDQRAVLDLAWETALERAGTRPEELAYIATTGEGEIVEFRTGHFYGMTAHARGAIFLDPEVRAVLDVGALHARAIVMDEHARVLGYRMTSQCASGSGQFLENIARYLGVTLDEVGPLSLQAQGSEQVSGICAVLAETDVINMVSRGVPLTSILRGIHESMAKRLAMLLKELKVVDGVVLVTGGLAADTGLLQTVREALIGRKQAEITVRAHPDSLFAGAIGAAIWGAYRHDRLAERAAAGAPIEGASRASSPALPTSP